MDFQSFWKIIDVREMVFPNISVQFPNNQMRFENHSEAIPKGYYVDDDCTPVLHPLSHTGEKPPLFWHIWRETRRAFRYKRQISI